ncbi:hypothetical protein EX30DRAFT_338662 [Ascodesmis nigricans]|uniref:MFS general substrate transporter n=1 Tax=Ascodesmis nigricans TaxID=341454 RepID=A0A4V3SJI1_9PEZI|nr:hypothetical protein EX30DRAFT_338662 [Ascodesmis nigricans]
MLFQCIGSILSSLILRHHPIRSALTVTVLVFAIPPVVIMITDVATGGESFQAGQDAAMKGRWKTEALFPLYCLCGVCYGIIELLKRVIPRALVGGDIDKLRQVDSIMHIFYEAAGTAGAFLSSFLLLHWGNVYSMVITPICFSLSAASWWFISPLPFTPDRTLRGGNVLTSLISLFRDFFASIALGAKLIFTSRRFCWLPIGYSLALYGHRYLENGLLPIIAEGYFREPAYTQIMVGGSNLGELLGALLVLVVGNRVKTPVPWIRMDALFLGLVWVLVFYRPVEGGSLEFVEHRVAWAWKVTPVLVPISLAWAAGDVSLIAFIQASLNDAGTASTNISALASVMAFLYSTYILLFAVLTPTLGVYADDTNEEDAHKAVFALGGIQYSIIAVVLFVSTFVMAGAWRWNPSMPRRGKKVAEVEMGDSEDIGEVGMVEERVETYGRYGRSYARMRENKLETIIEECEGTVSNCSHRSRGRRGE